MSTSRPGFALMFSLLMVMALSFVGLGMLAMGTREAAIAAESARRAQARTGAESAVVAVVEGWSTRGHAHLRLGDEIGDTAAEGVTTLVTRLDSALYLVTADAAGAVGAGDRPSTRASAGMLIRTLEPALLAGGFPGAVSAEGSISVRGGIVAGTDPCGGALPALIAPEIEVDRLSVLEGDPPLLRTPLPPMSPPDPFGAGLAPSLATVIQRSPTARPRPTVRFGECIPDDRNWGAIEPSSPCHGLLPFIYATGPLTIAGGVGRGILVVDGDVRFTEGAHFHGIVRATGRAELSGGSIVRGVVRAEHVVLRDAEVRRDGCSIDGSLSSPVLDRAFRPPTRWWVPAF